MDKLSKELGANLTLEDDEITVFKKG